MSDIKLFESKKVRSHWDEEKEVWYFSVVDIVEALTNSVNPTDYLKKLRKRDIELGTYLGTNCPQVEMEINGKKRKTLAGTAQHIFRIIQSIPSPKAEPFKQWLAKVGYERMKEIADPSQSIDRARENWQKLGRSEKWIQQRMTGQETRNKLTDYWKESGVEKEDEFALLTNIIHQEWTGLSVQKHKKLKELKSQNLRDHMSEAELIFTALAELSTRQIAETDEAKGLKQNAVAGKKGGKIAKDARLKLEEQTGKKVVTGENFLPPAKTIFKRRPTTEDLYIGTPEAESEGNNRAKVKLEEVFYDYLKVLPEIETEKFIVTGRKGSGKSAIGQVLFKRSKEQPNKFCDYIQKSDIDLEEIVQFSEKIGDVIQKELLFKWIILTRLLKLITENEAVQDLQEIKIIKHFLEKNTGFVRIDKYEIREILETTGFEVLIEKLTHFFTFKKTRETKLTGTKAPFYKLIPHLEEVVLTILNSNADKYQGNSYQIIFDDLDIDFKAEDKKSVETILNLIRIAKSYNNNLFSNNDIDAKIIILLRDDISDILVKTSADMAKIFSSYSISLMWFDHELYKKGENLTMLKQFIDNRISYALNKANITYDGNSWDFLFDKSNSYNETSFKYVVDHTFQTPRDLILFMQDLSKYKFEIPLQISEVNDLIGSYSNKAKGEIENALAIHFDVNEISKIFIMLRFLSKKSEFTYLDFENIYNKQQMNMDAFKCCELLFDYSLIGNKNSYNNMVYFKHRENNEIHYKLDCDKLFVLHRIVNIYFKNIK